MTVDFLRYVRGRHTYFKPVSDRAEKFCAHPAVRGLLCSHETTVCLGKPIELKGWYECYASEFEGPFVMEPPFTYEDDDPFRKDC